MKMAVIPCSELISGTLIISCVNLRNVGNSAIAGILLHLKAKNMDQLIRKLSSIKLVALSLATVWLVLGASLALSQQIADPNFTPNIADPAYTEGFPKVLFDEAPPNFHTSKEWYKLFADLITQDGYEVVPNDQPFQPGVLADYDILVVSNALETEEGEAAFTEYECGQY
jgi:hypothetical protein